MPSNPKVDDESQPAGARKGHLAQLFEAAGLHEIEETALSASLEHASFEKWWGPFTHGVGPAGFHVSSLDTERRAELGERCRNRLPIAPSTLTARAWAARGLG